MECPLVSIIVPVHNVADYLPRFLESALQQTWQNLEIVLIDDGSTDASGNICDEWEKRDKRIRVCHQQNAGVSAARNLGIRQAKGEYLRFADPDDMLPLCSTEALLLSIMQESCKVALGGTRYLDGNGKLLRERSLVPGVQTGIDCALLFANSATMWQASLFQASLFAQNQNEFLPLRYGEDLIFVTRIFIQAKQVCWIAESAYSYYSYAGTEGVLRLNARSSVFPDECELEALWAQTVFPACQTQQLRDLARKTMISRMVPALFLLERYALFFEKKEARAHLKSVLASLEFQDAMRFKAICESSVARVNWPFLFILALCLRLSLPTAFGAFLFRARERLMRVLGSHAQDTQIALRSIWQSKRSA
jgi:glycosyltransferase involved in cell wall biosynthesis